MTTAPTDAALWARGVKTARTPANLAAVRELTESDWSASAIAAHLGIARRTVTAIRTEIGCHGRPKGSAHEFIDEVAVIRAMTGDRTVTLNSAELHEAVTRLTDQGRAARAIAALLGVTPRTVTRNRAKARAA